MTPDQIASLAQSLKDNEVFQNALDTIRSDALESLVLTNPTDVVEINKHQATVRVVDALRSNFDMVIQSVQGRSKKPGVA